MQITMNGEQKNINSGSLAALVEELGLDMRKLAIEHNRMIVPRSLYAKTHLNEGDAIEIVQFIGGG